MLLEPGGTDNVDVNLDLHEIYSGYEGEEDFVTFKNHRRNSKEVIHPIGKRKVPIIEVFYSRTEKETPRRRPATKKEGSPGKGAIENFF